MILMTERELGRHEAMIEALGHRLTSVETTVKGFDTKLDDVLLRHAERAGERKMIALFATIMGGVGSYIMSIMLELWGHK